jgi:hypothetical protein
MQPLGIHGKPGRSREAGAWILKSAQPQPVNLIQFSWNSAANLGHPERIDHSVVLGYDQCYLVRRRLEEKECNALFT